MFISLLQNKIKSKLNRGFTLIEMLMSMTLFSIATVIIVGALISLQDAATRMKASRNLYSNLIFVIDDMSNEIKQSTSIAQDVDQLGNGIHTTLSFTPYVFGGTTSQVKYSTSTDGKLVKFDGVSTTTLTNDDIEITFAKFEIIGWEKYFTGDRRQTSVRVTINAKTKTNPISYAHVYKYITQRYVEVD